MIRIKNLNIILPAALLAALIPTPADSTPQAPVEPNQDLEWFPENLGGKRMTHREAIKAVEELSDGWRLPTDKEWEREIDRTKFNPALRDASKFPGIKSEAYWTSSRDASDPEHLAWIVSLYYGDTNINYRHYTAWVRPCRARRAPSQ